jgi:hypothetical protein
LLKLGVIVLVGYGAYRLIKSIGSYKAGQVINTNELSEVFEEPNESSHIDSNTQRYPKSYCSKCGKETEQCQNPYHWGSNRCIICNWGYGYANECDTCYRDSND